MSEENTLNLFQAIEAMKEGKKVALENSRNREAYYEMSNGEVVNERKRPIGNLPTNGYSIYIPPQEVIITRYIWANHKGETFGKMLSIEEQSKRSKVPMGEDDEDYDDYDHFEYSIKIESTATNFTVVV